MPTPDAMRFFLNWARERADEMNATLASLESGGEPVQSASRAQADDVLAGLRGQRDAFLSLVKKQAKASEAAHAAAKTQLEKQWAEFESRVNDYFESLGQQTEQQRTVFERLAETQMKAWRDATEGVRNTAVRLSADRRGDIDATVARMTADAAAAQARLQKAAEIGTNSWSALNAVLSETRAAFDRANQAAWSSFK
jgi:hypothetical protein